MRKLLLPVAAVLAWSVALAALSEFDAVDGDRQGAVSPAEHADAAGSMFMIRDAEVADQSGNLRQAEFYAGPTALKTE
jgi:hypothetical protein